MYLDIQFKNYYDKAILNDNCDSQQCYLKQYDAIVSKINNLAPGSGLRDASVYVCVHLYIYMICVHNIVYAYRYSIHSMYAYMYVYVYMYMYMYMYVYMYMYGRIPLLLPEPPRKPLAAADIGDTYYYYYYYLF